MSSTHPLMELVKNQKDGKAKGICSVCSANEFVLEATMIKGLETGEHILIEATCNQVNQFGGYTGMQPKDFKEFVDNIAERTKFPTEKIILAGDHLGPNPWKSDSAIEAMEKSVEMIKHFVREGFTKIHLDASMHLADDDNSKILDPAVAAERSAMMCKAAEDTYQMLKQVDPNAIAPVYVIGTEVPTPGGMQEEEELQVTTVEDLKDTIEISKQAFMKYGLDEAWKRVIAVVVQPGVEFGDVDIIEYNREKAKKLTEEVKNFKALILEGHSTDYQTPQALKELVEDGIAILKVGPGLTFAVREALFALSRIEQELFQYDRTIITSKFIDILDMAMLQNPGNWNKHYHGTEKEVRLSRKYSLSDRSRYYYLAPEVREATSVMIENLKKKEIPLTLLSQYLPVQYFKIRTGKLANTPEAIIIDCVMQVLNIYDYACDPIQKDFRLVPQIAG